MLGGMKKGQKHGAKSTENVVLGVLPQRHISGLGLKGHFIQMLAIKSETAGALLPGNPLSIQNSTMLN